MKVIFFIFYGYIIEFVAKTQGLKFDREDVWRVE